jgi:hypothetical protein
VKRIIITSVACAAVLGGGLAAAVPAMAGTSAVPKVVAKTYSPLHPDTTSASGTATQLLPDGNGPVWSYDNLHETFTVRPESGPGNFNVTVAVWGNYHGFADPRTAAEGSSDPGGILASQGSVNGTIRYDVQSASAPDPSLLPATLPDGFGLGAALHQLFPGDDQIVGGGAYSFTYANVGGAVYTQSG